MASEALAQIPCNGYEVAHVIKAPPVGGNPSPTWATAISPDGHYVTGTYRPGSIGGDRVFLFDAWSGDLFLIPLGPGFQEAGGNDVNNDGVICGSGAHVKAGKRAFVYDSKTQIWTGLVAEGEFGWSSANAINSSQTVCGFRSLNDGGDPVNPRAVYTWSQGSGFADLGVLLGPNAEATDITGDGVICGWTGSGATTPGAHGFIQDGSRLTILPMIPEGTTSALFAINESGLACGHGRLETSEGPITRAFSWLDGQLTDLGTLPGYLRSFALDVNEAGVIVGYSAEPKSGPNEKGTIWLNGQVIDVNALFEPGELEQVRQIQAISSDGVLVGRGVDAAGVAGFVLVPKPGSKADINNSCVVDVDDLLIVINYWGDKSSPADLDTSGVVDVGDLMIVIDNWGGES